MHSSNDGGEEMVDMDTIKEILSILATIAVTAAGSILAVKRLLLQWERNGLELRKTNAEESIITTLRVESERMFEQNQKLMEQLLSLQLQLGELHTSIGKLKLENDQLHIQINKLTIELKDLRGT